MTPTRKLLIASAALLATLAVYIHHTINTCGPVATDEARGVLLEQLRLERLDAKYLSEPDPSECMVSFSYSSPTERIDFTVIADPMHGPEVHRYDHAQDAARGAIGP